MNYGSNTVHNSEPIETATKKPIIRKTKSTIFYQFNHKRVSVTFTFASLSLLKKLKKEFAFDALTRLLKTSFSLLKA